MFYKNNQIQFGLILGLQKNKLSIQPLVGQGFFASPRQTLYQWKGKAFANAEEGTQYLSEKSAKTIELAKLIDLETIFELIEPGQAYELSELAQDFTNDPADPWETVALFLTLKEDQLRFHSKGLRFTSRSTEEIQKLEAAAHKAEQGKQKQIREQDWANSLFSGQVPETKDHTEEWEKFTNRLYKFVVHWQRSQEKDYFAELLKITDFHSLSIENAARKMLALTGKKMSWGQLQVLRLAVGQDFSDDTLTKAEKIATLALTQCSYKQTRKDLGNLATYTIDASTTKDFDDAISFQVSESETRLWVHIADVASYLTPDHALFSIASEKISSLYTPKGSFTMLPRSLSEGFFSLKAGQAKAALTFEFTFSLEGELQNSGVYPSLIQVDQNLSYLDADQKIATESDWGQVNQLMNLLTQGRVKKGALELDRQEYNLDITNPEAIKITTKERDTPANNLVQECAILVNSTAATIAKENKSPFFFRNQPPYSVNPDLPEGSKPQLKDLSIQPARLSLTADGHAALGLEAYGQVTSPIRRFVDLVGQHLLFALITNRPCPFSEEQLLTWVNLIEEGTKEYNRTERALVDHWKIRYLEQNSERTYPVTWERNLRSDLQLIRITEIGYNGEIYLEEPKENFEVRIESINPALNQVKFILVSSTEETE